MIPGITRLSSKGQIVIPQKIREKLGLREGDIFLVIPLSKDLILLKKLIVASKISEFAKELVEEIKKLGEQIREEIVEKALENLIKKYVQIILFLFILQNTFSLTLDLNLSKVYPSLIEPKSEATLFLCFLEPYKAEDIKFKIEPYKCVETDKEKEEVNEITGIYCFPLRLKIKCKEGIYWIKVKAEYYEYLPIGTKHKEDIFYYPLKVKEIPKVIIKEFYVENNYANEKAFVKLKFEKIGDARDLRIFFNSSYCFVEKSEIYLGNKTETSFYVKIPLTNICVIPFVVVYKDKEGLIYKEQKYITFPVYLKEGRISVYLENNEIFVKNETEIKIKVKNIGEKDFYNIILKVVPREIKINKQEFFIKELDKGEEKEIKIKVYLDKAEKEVYNLPIIIFYSDKYGKLYNDTFYLYLKVREKPQVKVYISDLKENEIEVLIANLGKTKIKDVLVEAACIGCKLEKSYAFIGEIEENDYDTATFKIYPLNETFKIKVKVYFEDINGKEKVIEKERKFTVKLKEEMNVIWIIPIIIILLIIVYQIRKKISSKSSS